MSGLSNFDRIRLLDRLRTHGPGFAKLVAPLYAQLGWRWGDCLGSGVPSELDIADHVEKLIQGMKGESALVVESGGVAVEIEHDGIWMAKLKFVFETEAY